MDARAQYVMGKRNSWIFEYVQDYRPLAHHGNGTNLEDKTKEAFTSGNWDLFSCKKNLIGCIPTDVQGVYTANFYKNAPFIIFSMANVVVLSIFLLDEYLERLSYC